MMRFMAEEPQSVRLSVTWTKLDDIPIEAANAFLVQITQGAEAQPGEIVLGIGVLAPPAIFGGRVEEVAAQLRELGQVAVKPITRVMFTRERAVELRNAIDQVLRAWDELEPKQS
jgi:hypothetical protein